MIQWQKLCSDGANNQPNRELGFDKHPSDRRRINDARVRQGARGGGFRGIVGQDLKARAKMGVTRRLSTEQRVSGRRRNESSWESHDVIWPSELYLSGMFRQRQSIVIER